MSSAQFRFGADPYVMELILARQSDFAQEIVTADGEPWPDGIVLQLRFDDTSDTIWTATVDSDTATWSETAANVTALSNRSVGRVRLFADDVNWANGTVFIRD